MTNGIIISLCVLLLLAYVFNISASRTKIPSVILLLLLGWAVRRATEFLSLPIPDVSPLLPLLGTIGLIMIVLEGSLELELDRSKLGVIMKSSLGALLSLAALAAGIAFAFMKLGHYDLKDSITNAIPLCVISSAIAIPSVAHLAARKKEFVIYESSFSDIMGVLLFNFFALNEVIEAESFLHFLLQLLIITAISFIATIGLSFFLSKINHHIKFVPIILLIVLIYSVSKIYHLPGLIFIMIFGLSIGNLDKFKRYKWIERFKPEELNREVNKFRELTAEGAFLVRALFFLLFGYLIETSELLNTDTLSWSGGIVGGIFLIRAIQLKLSRLPLRPLLFIAPRGLITILLFLSIDPNHTIPLMNDSLIIQVIILTALIMMIGLMTSRTKED